MGHEPFHRFERRVQPVDTTLRKQEALDRLQGTAWYETDSTHAAHDDYVTVLMDSGKPLCFDPKRITADQLRTFPAQQTGAWCWPQAEVAKYLPSWRGVGRLHGRQETQLYLNPRLTTLEYKTLPEVTIREHDVSAATIIQIGSLELFVDMIRPSELADFRSFIPKDLDWDNTCHLAMKRDTVKSMDSSEHHPEVAQPTFLREFKLGLEQLRRLGVSAAIGRPSDGRRARIYEAMGMQLVWNEVGDDFTLIRLNDLPDRLRL